MTPYNKQRDPQSGDRGGFRSPGIHALIPGIVLVGIGALFLLGNLHIVRVADWFAYWPVVLIAVGLVQLVDADHAGRRIVGGVLLALGGLFLADNLGYLTFRVEDLWPLALIAAGLLMLWNRTTGRSFSPWEWGYRNRHWARDRFATGGAFSGNQVHEFAMFGGARRVVTDQDFKGGQISSFFGGVFLDLTGAAMVGNTAVLNISTVYGGATIRIPTNWNLEIRGAGIFGGFGDHTVHPPNSPDMKHLIVRGAAVFGGVTFKN